MGDLTEAKIQESLDTMKMARYRLLVGVPFFGYLAMSLRLTPTPGLQFPAATDGVRLRYDPNIVLNGPYGDTDKDKFLEFIIAHEAEHLALGHFIPSRVGNRHPFLWNISADALINNVLADLLKVKPNGLVDMPEMKGLFEEEIYEKLESQITKIKVKYGENGDMEFTFEHGDGTSDKEKEEIEKQWADNISDMRSDPEGYFQEILAKADAFSKMYGHDPRKIDGLDLDKILHPPLPWKVLLRRFTGSIRVGAGTDWTHPNKRMPFYWPARRGQQQKVKIRIAIDSSGSISNHDLGLFLVEIDSMLDIIDPDFAVFDTEIELRTKNSKEIERRMSNGGTSFDPAFEDLEPGCKAVIILTDGYAPAPKIPSVPVFWAMTPGTKPPVNWGWVGEITEGDSPKQRRR